ncbi:Maltodextrin glucosidase [Caenispirillum salinarum AK4]|uniref:Maltodextrin glucosidase n=1 Tax=Caenispirillum salinarum AK4 TaxID=1238182 RepID=K9H693_9PROT|nr:alpha-glucosidase [Caenispirillum salinarum]EKV32584.1 Maltodextrin glucosidase [Caenispirillum salinarum AK4]
MTGAATPEDHWRGAVVYQVYPRSFRDGSGDGIGDLPGIIEKLPYIASLGVDAVWISPFFASPMHDFGYDVSDYRAVEPMFGTLADADRLVAEAHRLGLKVLIDFVLAHTSDEHPWFKDSRVSREGAHADWYIWADPKPDGSPPNNWLSVFGGGAWGWEPRRRQYYLHHFLSTQPKLNLRHEPVVNALEEIAAWWLDRGVDGFRLDAVDFMVSDPAMPDNPPHPTRRIALRPYNMQLHENDLAHPETVDVLMRLRRVMDDYPDTFAIAEVGSEPAKMTPLERAEYYTAQTHDPRIHMAYTLGLMKGPGTATAIRDAIEHVETHINSGWLCWAFSNHDVERVVSRWGDGSPASAKLFNALLLSLRGAVCVYQGEELGLTEAEVPQDRLRDPYGITYYPHFKGRDGSRTPMPWTAEPPAGGFSDSGEADLWLPLPPEHLERCVARQEADPESVLAHWRRFIDWRRTQDPLRFGALTMLPAGDPVLAFEREHDGARLVCAFNLGAEPATVAVPAGSTAAEGHGWTATAPDADGVVRLDGWGAWFGTR